VKFRFTVSLNGATLYLRRSRVNVAKLSGTLAKSSRSRKARDLGRLLRLFISDFAAWAALPFSSITITSIPLSLVFSGRWFRRRYIARRPP